MKSISYIELKILSEQRLKEATILLENKQYDGCIYLAGYVIELALKARICKILDLDTFPDYPSFKTHKYDDLITLSGLEKAFDNERKNSAFNKNWVKFSNWNVSIRYSTMSTNNEKIAKEMISALVTDNNGILTWIKERW